MGDVCAFVLAIGAVLIVLGLLLGWMNYKIDKLKTRIHMLDDVYVRKENAAAAIRVLEGTIKKLNSAYRELESRIDILESGHPDSDIDYATLDDHDEVVCVWFEGKKYVPEDKRDEDTSTLYADNKVVAETTRPEETRCCATCQYYRPESGFSTCDLRTWLHTTKKYATMADSACNNYEKAYAATKGEVDCPYIQYKNMSGNGPAEQMAKRVYELQCEIQRLNMIAQFGCTAQELRQRWEELMRNDT